MSGRSSSLCARVYAAAAAFALGLAATPAARADEKSYTLVTDGSSSSVKVGADGKFALHIKPAAGYHVNKEGPFKIVLSGDRVKPALDRLERKHAKDGNVESPRFEVALKGVEAGAGKLQADATFVICSETVCERRVEKLALAVDVKP
jgi:hypothetical protein